MFVCVTLALFVLLVCAPFLLITFWITRRRGVK